MSHRARRPNMGVEEEFLLADARDGRLLPYTREVADSARRAGAELDLELRTAQVETNTTVCRDVAELRDELTETRAQAAAAATRQGAGLLPAGVAVAPGGFAAVTDNDRYSAMATHCGALAREYEVCGCHVHVEVDDRETAIRVSNHLGPGCLPSSNHRVLSPVPRQRHRLRELAGHHGIAVGVLMGVPVLRFGRPLRLDPVTSRSISSSQRISQLIAHVRPALEAPGELDTVSRTAERMLAGQSGAATQRRQFQRRHYIADVVAALCHQPVKQIDSICTVSADSGA